MKPRIPMHSKQWEALGSLPPHVLHTWLGHGNILSYWTGLLHVDRSVCSPFFFVLSSFPKHCPFVQDRLGEFMRIKFKCLYLFVSLGFLRLCIWVCKAGFSSCKQSVNSEHLLDLSAVFPGLHLSTRDQNGNCSVGLLCFLFFFLFFFFPLSWILMFTRETKKTELL